MGAFKIEIVGVGGHGCERTSKPGEKLYHRCGRFGCPDCMAYEFLQQLRQKGMVRDGEQAYSVELADDDSRVVAFKGARLAWEMQHGEQAPAVFTYNGVFVSADGKHYLSVPMSATFTHWPEQSGTVVDDMLKNERKSGQF